MLSLEDRTIVKGFGITLLDHLTITATSTLLYGVSTQLFYLSAFIAFQRRKRSLAPRVMLFATLMSFLLSTLYWGTRVAQFADAILIGLVEVTSLSAYTLRVSAFRANLIYDFTLNAVQIMSDAIIIWRAWVLCAGRRWLTIVPMILLLGTAALACAFTGLIADFDTFIAYEDGEKATANALLYATGALVLSTNIVSTSLIAYRLWVFRKEWKRSIGSRWSGVQKVLLMIIESGALYAVLQLLAVCTFKADIKPDTPRGYFKDVIWPVGYIQTTAMYPTIVLLLIEQKLSFTDMDSFDSSSTTQQCSVGERNLEKITSLVPP